MPVVVACRCGQRFAAEDRLIGQQVACPVCGSPLVIPGPAVITPELTVVSPAGVRVTCGCGRAFLAPASMRGQQTNCPACGGVIHIPELDPFNLGDSGYGPSGGGMNSSPLGLPGTRQPAEAEIPWTTLGYMGVIGLVILVVAITVTSIRTYLHERRAVVEGQPSAVAPAPAPATKIVPAPSTPAPSMPPAAAPSSAPAISAVPPPTPGPPPPPQVASSAPVVGSSATPRADVSSVAKDSASAVTGLTGGAPVDGAAVAKLPDGVQSWYEQPGARLTGIRRVGAEETATANFSWMTGLLPFLGHGKTYERIDFNQVLTKGANLQVGGTLIPEFLNPLDDRQRWKGYPLDGMALTHFAGMSGVEDARNVVAAKLPRSDPRAGVFGYDEVARPEQITDGTSQTIMIVGTGELPNPWIFGGGATIRGAREPLFDKMSGLGTKGLAGGGTLAVMADGSVRHVTAGVDPKVFRALSTIHGAETVDLEKSAQPFALESLKAPAKGKKK